MNTDQSDKNGTHWWSFLDLHPRRQIFMFDCLGFKGFKELVIQDDQKIINKILYGVKKFDKKGNKITLLNLRFSIPEYKKLKSFRKLNKAAVDLLYLINEYSKNHSLRNEVIVRVVDDQLQMIGKDICGMYQIYFYINLFNPLENSRILTGKKPE